MAPAARCQPLTFNLISSFSTSSILKGFHVLFISLRDRAYLYYVLAMAATSMWIAQITGVTREFVWPGTYPHLFPMVLLLGATWVLIIRFTQVYLQTSLHMPRLHRVLWGTIVWQGGVYLGLALGMTARVMIPVLAVGNILIWVILPRVAVLTLRRGYRPALFFLIGYGSLVTAGVVTNLSLLGFIQPVIISVWYCRRTP